MRYYCPQYNHWQKGWVDIEPLASINKKAADGNAKRFAEEYSVITRAIRKPKGWEPDREKYEIPVRGPSLKNEIDLARKEKL